MFCSLLFLRHHSAFAQHLTVLAASLTWLYFWPLAGQNSRHQHTETADLETAGGAELCSEPQFTTTPCMALVHPVPSQNPKRGPAKGKHRSLCLLLSLGALS